MKEIKLVLLLLVGNLCLAQNTYTNETLGFSMEQTENWIVAKNGEIEKNLKEHVKLDSETLNKLIDQNKGTIPVVTFYKYPIETTPGVIPTIKVNLRKNNTPSFEVFKTMIEESFSGIKNVFPDFRYVTKPFQAQIGGFDCVKAVCTYTLKANSGQEKVTITVYAVPVNNQFYQITFMDSDKENNTALYDQLVQTMVLK
jgi:hypothetical protein